ncbi:GNAT family N-acetyltransferase [Mangrovimonas spongiae]|uniref:GNAT family N-acetyltransferase n=1 Tax=Mangrovimonas spongiae TaxID=2494697 RepID=A0A3R9NP99_9FLAO|nr:GNAT family N-acetyltransferase [Mangrovimonas spongiae]RSK38555.1 GNAT family N-acetyltransferase [Mangrovimonas spongiae]
MVTIEKATIKEAQLLSKLGTKTFLQSHGHSASKQDIAHYVSSHLNIDVFLSEVKDNTNHFWILYYNKQPIGYYKIVPNATQNNISHSHVTKLERLYLLEEFQHLKLGLKLFNHAVKETKRLNQNGLWLFTWVENHRAIAFYKKAGFKIVGEYNFKISNSHSNPNHQMLLLFD